MGFVALLLIGTGVLAFSWYSNSNKDVRRDGDGTSLERSKTELSETEGIQDDPEKSKQSTSSDTVPTPTTNPTTGMREVNVVLTNTGLEDGQVEASGFVSNLVEEGGTCTFTFTQNQRTVNKSTNTVVNPTSTTCRTVRFNESELGQGEWKVIIRYSSSTATGTSNEGSLVIK